jgi:glyoxylase-like metal-dependent hydrolase (beta-lactamase superfamily II)/rhodanese-related sulfurtransferase
MIFRQIPHDDLGCASYLIGDDGAGVAAVVDPKFEIEGYLELARYMGVSIEHILETHNHADHVSGHGKLAAATGATIHINRKAEADYEHEPFDHGFELELGNIKVRAIHTPGHRPEHTAFALIDTSRGEEPWALLTGDSLFVNDVARPDLAIDKEEGAHAIFSSLHERILRLPPETEVWPGHLGGSLCGGPAMDMKPSSTLAYERAHNPMLQVEDEGQFVERAVGSLGPQPPNFEAIVALNKGELVTEGVELVPLTPRQVEQKRTNGALLVDVRTDLQFDEAHIFGAVAIPAVQAGFGTRLAWLADREQEIVLVGRDNEDARRAATLGLAVGIRKLGGFLHGGMTEWRREKRPVERIERIELEDLPERTESEPEMQILDVREQSERDAGYIPGSLFEPWHDIDELPEGFDPQRPVAVMCASGQRAAVASSLVQRYGAERVLHVVNGGVPKWGRLGHPIEEPAQTQGPGESEPSATAA